MPIQSREPLLDITSQPAYCRVVRLVRARLVDVLALAVAALHQRDEVDMRAHRRLAVMLAVDARALPAHARTH